MLVCADDSTTHCASYPPNVEVVRSPAVTMLFTVIRDKNTTQKKVCRSRTLMVVSPLGPFSFPRSTSRFFDAVATDSATHVGLHTVVVLSWRAALWLTPEYAHTCARPQYVEAADRLMNILAEEGLARMATKVTIQTPCGATPRAGLLRGRSGGVGTVVACACLTSPLTTLSSCALRLACGALLNRLCVGARSLCSPAALLRACYCFVRSRISHA